MITPVNFIKESPAGVGVGRYGDFIHTFTGGLAYSIIQMFFLFISRPLLTIRLDCSFHVYLVTAYL